MRRTDSPGVPSYPQAPPGWTATGRRKVGPFTVRVTFRRDDGATTEWRSRAHRKSASLISRPGGSGWWAPHRASWWIGALFAVGATCFAVGPCPGFVQLVGAPADAAVFFAGSLFFTAAAALQYLETINADRGPARQGARTRLRVLAFEPRRIDWWATAIQLAGTLLFNLSTYEALRTGLSNSAVDRLIWSPDVLGCVCFLVASGLCWVEVCGGVACRPRRQPEWWIAAVNLAGSVAFAIAGAASYVVPDTGDVLHLAAANFTTVIGGLCFLAGAVLLLFEGAHAHIPDSLVPARA